MPCESRPAGTMCISEDLIFEAILYIYPIWQVELRSYRDDCGLDRRDVAT